MLSFHVSFQFYKMQLLDALAQIEIQEAKRDKKLEKCWLKANTGDSDLKIELQALQRCKK